LETSLLSISNHGVEAPETLEGAGDLNASKFTIQSLKLALRERHNHLFLSNICFHQHQSVKQAVDSHLIIMYKPPLSSQLNVIEESGGIFPSQTEISAAKTSKT